MAVSESTESATRLVRGLDPTGHGITEQLIERLVRHFYARLRQDTRLGPIFESRIGADWEPHLQTMIAFWSSLMLTTGRYSGRPLQKHLVLKMVRPEDFDIWLRLFEETAVEIGGKDVADAFLVKAKRVVASFKMAMFFDPSAPRSAQG